MPLILRFLLRVLLLLAGLAVGACLLVLLAFVLAAWSLRAAWARLTGRQVAPLGIPPGAWSAFEAMLRRARPVERGRSTRGNAAGRRRPGDDVTDVQPRQPS